MKYAKEKKVRLSRFKQFDGSIETKKLSLYAAAYNDRTEIISECFSGAYSSGERNKFAL